MDRQPVAEIGPTPKGGATLGGILLLTLALRLAGIDQPIVENYVGRQIPTAMVARNLERGSGFLRPCLDVAPFPNWFLVEPPVYESLAVGLRRLTGLPLDGAGRAVSALGVVLAAWGVYGLVASRAGRRAGLVAAGALACFPVTVRYGRAFQPDALMLGAVVAGLNCWDRFEAGGDRVWLAAGWSLTAAGLALKVTSAFVLVPLVFELIRRRPGRGGRVALAGAALLPAALWYAHAASALAAGEGSHASADNSALWWRALDPFVVFRRGTLGLIVRFLGVRAFTPLGPWLAVAGLVAAGRAGQGGARLWVVWGGAALAAMVAVASKLHHEYYWLALAPVVASGIGLAAAWPGVASGPGRTAFAGLLVVLFALGVVFSWSTWRTPEEWGSLPAAAAAVRARVPVDAWVAAPEALLYASDRRGCRVEFTAPAARRAAREWAGQVGPGETDGVTDPATLLEFYRLRGARFFADVVPVRPGASRLALHEAVRGRYKILVDRSGVLLAALQDPDPGAGRPDHGIRPR